jgi:hypothetical protein
MQTRRRPIQFDVLLECGILSYCFLHLRCADCTREKLVAFSCELHGFCSSCDARRTAETRRAPC